MFEKYFSELFLPHYFILFFINVWIMRQYLYYNTRYIYFQYCKKQIQKNLHYGECHPCFKQRWVLTNIDCRVIYLVKNIHSCCISGSF